MDLPAWLTAQVPEDAATKSPQNPTAQDPEISPVEALIAATNIHLDTFRRQHPAATLEAGRDPLSLDEAEQRLPPVLHRLLWNIAQITRWNEQDMPWLPSVLTDIQQALTTRDPVALVVSAPATDDETAAVLAELPTEFATRLAPGHGTGIPRQPSADRFPAGGWRHLCTGAMPTAGHQLWPAPPDFIIAAGAAVRSL